VSLGSLGETWLFNSGTSLVFMRMDEDVQMVVSMTVSPLLGTSLANLLSRL